jgi:kynureninase
MPTAASSSPSRADAEARDRADPLRSFRDRFLIDDADLIYLDGNSLGRLPLATAERLRHVVEREWGEDLIASWEHWIGLPGRVGDAIGTSFLGAAPGQVVVADSTTVNLYKLAVAALAHRGPDRQVIVTDAANFPTDRYVFQSLGPVRLLDSDPVLGPSADDVGRACEPGDVGLVSFSHVAYRSGALADAAAITAAAHEAGALVLWDVSHSVGSVPIELDRWDVDLAAGCTYKYLNGGPGAPAFAYVAARLHPVLRQPIWGWLGQPDPFEMGPVYDPAPGINQLLSGSPNVIALSAIDEGVKLLSEAGVDRLRAKGMALTGLVIDLAEDWLAPLGVGLATPRDPARRGSHVSLRHPDADRICRLMVERIKVVPDFRRPDVIRLGPAPLTTRFVDVWDAMDRLRGLLSSTVL